jgi:hypothetical protein
MLAGLASSACANEDQSILERVQVIEDPELGELVRIALANLLETKEAARLYQRWRRTTSRSQRELREEYQKKYDEAITREEARKPQVVRAVTETYAQIKLLDTQIKEIEKKIGTAKTTDAIRSELILARAELEARRTTKLAELREIMSIVPKHAFGRKPLETLSTWLSFDVIGDFVYVFNYQRPYQEGRSYWQSEPVGAMSRKAALGHIKDLMKEKHRLPVRVDVFRNESGIRLSEELYEELMQVFKDAKVELDAEVYLDDEIRQKDQGSEYFVRQGKIYDDERSTRRQSNQIDEEHFFTGTIKHLVGLPKQLPRKIIIKYDADSKDLAVRMVNAIKAKAKELGVERFVEIELEETEWEVPEEEEKEKRAGRR